MQTSHEPFIIIRIFALHNPLQKSSRDTFFSMTFSCTESRSKDHCSVRSLFLRSALFWITPVFLFLLILFKTSSLMSYSPLVLLFYSAGLYTSGFSTTEWESAHKTGLALKPNTKDFFWEMEGKASWGAHRWGLQLCRGCVGLRCYGDSKRAVFQYHLPYAICYSVSLDFFVSIPVKFHIQDCLEMFFCSKKHRNVYERLHYYCLPAFSVIIVHTKSPAKIGTALKYI